MAYAPPHNDKAMLPYCFWIQWNAYNILCEMNGYLLKYAGHMTLSKMSPGSLL